MPEDLATVREAREALRACEERNTGGWIDCLERTTRLANTVIAQAGEIERLRKALEFYAVEHNHVATEVDADSMGMHSRVLADEGERARKALEE